MSHRRRLERLEAQHALQATPRANYEALFRGDLDGEFLPGISIASLLQRSPITDVVEEAEDYVAARLLRRWDAYMNGKPSGPLVDPEQWVRDRAAEITAERRERIERLTTDIAAEIGGE